MFYLIQILFIMYLFTLRNQNFLLYQCRSVCLEGKTFWFFPHVFSARARESATFVLCLSSYPEGWVRVCCCFIRCRFFVSLSLAVGLSRGCPPRERCVFFFYTFLRSCTGVWVYSTFSGDRYSLPTRSAFAGDGNSTTSTPCYKVGSITRAITEMGSAAGDWSALIQKDVE